MSEAELEGLENDINHISLSPPHEMDPAAGYDYDYDVAGPSGEGGSGYAQPAPVAQQAHRSHRHRRPEVASGSSLRCHICNETFNSSKNRMRHDLSKKHRDNLAAIRPTPDVVKSYQCACSYTQARKDLYRRHLATCRFPFPAQFGPQVLYNCNCGFQDNDKDEHMTHINVCGRKRWSKGRGSSEAARST
ncbi:hypothetical protein B0T24DRAFT_632469 [Lasiosphaeria ovina]|uniref:C2H2-type domain-containing protein n=1 Tax=Lasiosphaeria ovina TaxID=92902 RepID=A0AAE0N3C3_9PEZI|nr:hypothetical protein B0T24DRAFT_632469 [Lasiosphaeria ovina]